MSWRWALARRVATLVGSGTGGGGAQAQRLFSSSGALLRRLPPPPHQIRNEVVACRGSTYVSSRWLHDATQYKTREDGASRAEEQQDPFELVADELSILANRLRSMVAAEVPKLASAAEYFFKMGAEGKRFRPTVLLLMASALKFPISESTEGGVFSMLASTLRTRQQNIAEITEMIHVASLLHDDVLDDADTRRGVTSLNCIMGNKLSVLAGDFLLSRACVALAALGNTEVVSLMATAVEHLVTGETMQISTSREQRRSGGFWGVESVGQTNTQIFNRAGKKRADKMNYAAWSAKSGSAGAFTASRVAADETVLQTLEKLQAICHRTRPRELLPLSAPDSSPLPHTFFPLSHTCRRRSSPEIGSPSAGDRFPVRHCPRRIRQASTTCEPCIFSVVSLAGRSSNPAMSAASHAPRASGAAGRPAGGGALGTAARPRSTAPGDVGTAAPGRGSSGAWAWRRRRGGLGTVAGSGGTQVRAAAVVQFVHLLFLG